MAITLSNVEAMQGHNKRQVSGSFALTTSSGTVDTGLQNVNYFQAVSTTGLQMILSANTFPVASGQIVISASSAVSGLFTAIGY